MAEKKTPASAKPAGKAAGGAKPEAKAADAKGAKAAKPAADKAAAPKAPQTQRPDIQLIDTNGKPRMRHRYESEIRAALKQAFGYKNDMQVPRLEKIVINMGVGEATQDSKKAQNAANDLALIAGQKPVITKSRKAIAQFKLREGLGVGCKVTLRGTRMYEFLDRLVTVAMPRIRDFRGIPGKSFDGNGNYSMGIKEQIVFPEIDYDKIDAIRGMDIIFVTTAKTDAEAKALLRAFDMPFMS